MTNDELTAHSADSVKAAAENAPYEAIERAGRKGYKFHDGSILWADGEKEVPTSGKSDEQKRNEARVAAGASLEPTKPGVSSAEMAAIEAIGRKIADPAALMALRKANAKAHAGKPPGNGDDALPPSLNELQSNFRVEAKHLLEREIDRIEELKVLAMSGAIQIAQNGAFYPGRNPAMALHEAILTAIRVADTGNPNQLLAELRKLQGWTVLAEPRIDELPYPPPDGYPTGGPGVGPAPPIPPPISNPGLNRASDALQPGGQPTEYNAPKDPLAPPPVTPPLADKAKKK